MNFIFICPNPNKVFESADFSVIENRGVISDGAGNKTLDSKVEMREPHPICGEKDVYHVNELLCPFHGLDRIEEG